MCVRVRVCVRALARACVCVCDVCVWGGVCVCGGGGVRSVYVLWGVVSSCVCSCFCFSAEYFDMILLKTLNGANLSSFVLLSYNVT